MLWLARAVEAEGEPRKLVAQTLVNRWAWLLDKQPTLYPTLAALVRAYAQPVNPRWYPDGDLFLKQLAKVSGEKERNALLDRARLRQTVHSTRSQFSAATRAAVESAMRGPILIPPGATHYAIPGREAAGFPVLVPGGVRENSIYGEPGGRATNALYSFVQPGPTLGLSRLLSDVPPHGVLGFLLLAGTGAFVWARGLKPRRR